MLLSAITDEISPDFAYALSVMKEYGCVGAELRGLWKTNVADLSDEQIDEALRILDRYQMSTANIACPLFKCELGDTPEARAKMVEDQMAMLARCTKIARRFGIKFVRTFSILKRGDLTPEIEDAIAAAMVGAVRYAEDNDIVLLLENEHACYHGTGAEAAKFISRMGSQALRAIWDPGNAFFAGERPFPDGYEAIRNYVEHVHVKDAELLASGKKRFLVVGEGEIDYKGQFAALKAEGYSGYISLETHYAPFAGTREQGSRLSLQGLSKLLAE